jgi:hypothetical protein
MYSTYDLFEEHPDGKLWKGTAQDREDAAEKLKELTQQAKHPVLAINLMTRETLKLRT